MEIGITGGNGFIGSTLVRKLLDEGHRVTCLIRKTSNIDWLQRLDIDFIYGDVCIPETLPPFVSGKDIIYHLAGLVKGKTENHILQVNAGGTKNLLEAIHVHNQSIHRFLFVSSQEAVGLVDTGEPWTEEIDPQPTTAYGKSKYEAEKICRTFMPAIPITIIRPCPVYGPRDTETFIFFKLVSKGFSMTPRKEGTVSVMFSENLATFIYAASLSEKSKGQVYFAADEDIIRLSDFNQIIADTLGKKTVKMEIPQFILFSAAGLNEFFSSLAGKIASMNRDKIKIIVHHNLSVSIQKAKNDFGFFSETPITEGIKKTIEWYLAHGWLK